MTRTEPESKQARATVAEPRLDQLATALHASFLSRWGRHDPAGLERAVAERKAEPVERTSVA